MRHQENGRELRGLLVASIAIPLLLLAAASWRDWGETYATAEREVERSAALVAEHALKVFDTQTLVLDEMDERIKGMDWQWIGRSEEVHRFLKRIGGSLEHLDSLWLTGPTGKTWNSSLFFPMPEVSVADRDYFRALADGDTLFVSETYPGRLSGNPGFHLARRRSTPDGRFDGVVLVASNTRYFEKYFAGVARVPGDTVSLVRADGTVLVRYPSLGQGTFRFPPDNPLTRAAEKGSEQGTVIKVSARDGEERLYAYHRLGAYPVFVTYGRAVAAVQGEWLWHVAYFAMFAVPSALLLCLASWMAMRRSRAERRAYRHLAEEVERRRGVEAMLHKVQRLEVLGQIAGGIAHDFNNLLMVITSNLYLAKVRAGDDSPAATFIETASQAAFRGGQLTQQLLTFARQQRLKPEPVDINAALADLAEGMLKRSLRGDIAVETRLASTLWPVTVDRAQLELAVLNLAVNARDAMPAGGRLLIATRTVQGGADGGPPGMEGDFVALTVSDTGVGIDPSVRERVFDPFFTTKEVGKGTGLGLSQVYGFATQSGGAVVLDSVVGQGTSVTIFLPRAMETLSAAEPSTPAMAPSGAGHSVLVVEDSPDIGTTVSTLLEGLGYRVEHVEDAEQALARLGAGERFDAVLSDIVMPGGMNGLDLGRAIRRRWPDVPVMLTTGYSAAADTAAAEGFRLLVKPYRPEALSQALRELLRARAA